MALISMIAVAFGTLLSVDPKRIARIIDYMRTAILPIFGLVFLLDCLTAPGVAVPMLYAMPVLMTSICVGLEWSLASAVLATVLTYIGFVLSPLGGNIEDGTVNRLIAAVLIWVCVVFGWLVIGLRPQRDPDVLRSTEMSLHRRLRQRAHYTPVHRKRIRVLPQSRS